MRRTPGRCGRRPPRWRRSGLGDRGDLSWLALPLGIEEGGLHHLGRDSAALELDGVLHLEESARLGVTRVDRGERDVLLEDRRPGVAGHLAHLAAVVVIDREAVAAG